MEAGLQTCNHIVNIVHVPTIAQAHNWYVITFLCIFQSDLWYISLVRECGLLALQYIDLLCSRSLQLQHPDVDDFITHSPDSSDETISFIISSLIHTYLPTIIPGSYAKLFPQVHEALPQVVDLIEDQKEVARVRVMSGIYHDQSSVRILSELCLFG